MFKLRELGWCEFFARQIEKESSLIPPRVAEESRDFYRIFCEQGDLLAELSGKLRNAAASRSELPAVGDWMTFPPISRPTFAITPRMLRSAAGASGPIPFILDLRKHQPRQKALAPVHPRKGAIPHSDRATTPLPPATKVSTEEKPAATVPTMNTTGEAGGATATPKPQSQPLATATSIATPPPVEHPLRDGLVNLEHLQRLAVDGIAGVGHQDARGGELRCDGLPVAAMTPAQRHQFIDLIALYTDRLPLAHAKLRLDEVRRHAGETIFAWIGQFDPASPFYYRIYSPVIFIEFYHQPGVALPNTGYNRRHAHALMRTPNGNDYGRELLRQCRAGDPG